MGAFEFIPSLLSTLWVLGIYLWLFGLTALATYKLSSAVDDRLRTRT
jgi:hypothetical protein